MAGTSRALTLKLLADIDNFTKNINKADNEVVTFGDKITKFGKVAGAAFLAAGVAAAAYAGKLAIDGVKSAIEDEAAQAKLAATLRNVTGATDAQIAATEDYVLKQSLLFGITDDQLRPSLDRLTRATGDVTKAQKLQSIAIDIAAGTGKSLQAVTESLSKAQEGNLAGLSRLGVGLTKAEFDEAKETVGAFILDAITPLVENIVKYVVPAITAFVEGFEGGSGLKNAFTEIARVAQTILVPIFEGLQKIFNSIKKAVMDNEEAFAGLWSFLKNVLAPFLGGAFKVAFEVIAFVINEALDAVGKLIRAFQLLFEAGNKVKNFLGFGGSSSNASNASLNAPGIVNAPFVPMAPSGGYSGQAVSFNNNITVNGAIDSESTARQIVEVLNQSSYRGTLGAGAFA